MDKLKEKVTRLFSSLRDTFLWDRIVLGGSSGLFGFATNVPAYTEDFDLIIPEKLVETKESAIIEAFEKLGHHYKCNTSTFVDAEGDSFDLIGYSDSDAQDRLAGGAQLRVMVFGDLSRVLSSPKSVMVSSEGVRCLSPPAFCVVKLLTMRLSKGAKDKLQALLVIAEHAEDQDFRETFLELMKSFGPTRREDIVPDAQVAFLSVSRDPMSEDVDAQEYARFLQQLERGLEKLAEFERDYA